MKKTFINFILIIVAFVIYFLQSNFFNWFTIAGVKPNLFIIYILFIGLFCDKSKALIFGAIIGLVIDLIFEESVGPNFIPLTLVGFIAIVFNKNFSKDSRITIILMVLGSTLIFEIIKYFICYAIYTLNVEILSFIKILAIETIFNIIITIIIYPLIQRFGYYIENEYTGNQILTRYF